MYDLSRHNSIYNTVENVIQCCYTVLLCIFYSSYVNCTRRLYTQSMRKYFYRVLELLPSLTCTSMALTCHHNFYKYWYMVNLSLILLYLCLHNEDSLFIFHPTGTCTTKCALKSLDKKNYTFIST